LIALLIAVGLIMAVPIGLFLAIWISTKSERELERAAAGLKLQESQFELDRAKDDYFDMRHRRELGNETFPRAVLHDGVGDSGRHLHHRVALAYNVALITSWGSASPVRWCWLPKSFIGRLFLLSSPPPV
jgi:hypothetical protein